MPRNGCVTRYENGTAPFILVGVALAQPATEGTAPTEGVPASGRRPLAAAPEQQSRTVDSAGVFDITAAKARLCAADGGYETVHESRRLHICVYTLVAPEPDHQRTYANDEIYVVLEGRGMLDVEGEHLELQEGRAAFVPAGAEHSFSAYEHLTVLAIRGPGSQGRSRRQRFTGIAS